jgi:hypothetical protein
MANLFDYWQMTHESREARRFAFCHNYILTIRAAGTRLPNSCLVNINRGCPMTRSYKLGSYFK